jgi:hypothetical protein
VAEFIFMLTNHDVTVPDALEVYEEVRRTDLRWVGFKDVGLPPERLRELVARMHEDGRQVVLEVVSLDEASERHSVELGLELGVDLLMGGTRPNVAVPLLAGSGTRYFPFPGRIVGHPSILEGTLGEIAASAAALTTIDGVDGIDLLAYRFAGDVPALIEAVVAASHGPIVAAGSIETEEQIGLVSELGCWGFTVGRGVFERTLVPGGSICDQIRAALDASTDKGSVLSSAVSGA